MVFLVKSHTFACKKSGSLTHLCMVKSQDVLPSCAHTWSSKAWSSEVPLLPLSADVVWNTLRGFWEATKKHWYGYVVYIYIHIYIYTCVYTVYIKCPKHPKNKRYLSNKPVRAMFRCQRGAYRSNLSIPIWLNIWVNYNISPTWILRPFGDDFPIIHHDFPWGRTVRSL